MVPTIPRLRADTVNPGVYPIDSKPFGLTYGGWSAKWWQWSAAIPKDANPTADTSGKNCVLGQNDQHVWFLSGTGGARRRGLAIYPSVRQFSSPFSTENARIKIRQPPKLHQICEAVPLTLTLA